MEKVKTRVLGLALCLCLVLAPVSAGADTVLRLGDKGAAVTQLQTKLARWGYDPGAVDGVFGVSTRQAVIRFQKKNGLTPDGVVGARTAAALGLRLSGASTSPGSAGATPSDVDLLAHLIYGEARGEPYTGQVAVAAVALNRVESPLFPNTLSGVVYQKGAFTAVADGQIRLNPDDSAYRAARDALNGWDPSGGALYYYNAATSTSQWIYDRPVVAVIGKHRFAV